MASKFKSQEFHQLSENLEMVIRTTTNTDSQIIPDALEMIGEIRINFKEQVTKNLSINNL
jgi:hypothetical protein